ncbi:MAG: hypothetical protein ACJA2O_004135 [Candidatus Azotimanducaceae bacterium]|jgi:hypothetical protein
MGGKIPRLKGSRLSKVISISRFRLTEASHAIEGSVASGESIEAHGRMIFPYHTKLSNACSHLKADTLLNRSFFSVFVGTVHTHSAIETLKR